MQKIFAGIDLAGSPKRPTGFCFISFKKIQVMALYTDSEIVENILKASPQIIAIDAPLTLKRISRVCDKNLKKYGALPLSLKGMQILAKRGFRLAEHFRKLNFEIIEVFPTATAKILGIYNKDARILQKNLESIDKKFKWQRALSKAELDAVLASITAKMYFENSYDVIGNTDGIIIVPKLESFINQLKNRTNEY